MLNQKDIDVLQLKIQNGETPELYYIANVIELRERYMDESYYKSVDRYRIVKVKISEINNAYFEYLNYKNNPNNYHVEEEIVYYGINDKYINYYTVPNTVKNNKDFNPKQPSMIYGIKRKLYNGTEFIGEYEDKSPIKEVYTNDLEYGDMKKSEVLEAFNNGKLDWKYMRLENGRDVDGIIYEYLTSDWYTIRVDNFPKTELTLINTKQNSSFFINLGDACNWIEQFEA